MRVLIDTNVLFFAVLFPNSRPAKAVLLAHQHCDVVLCDQNIAELREIIRRKAPHRLSDAEFFLAGISYELVPAVEYAEKLIRDAKDQPILNAAIVFGVDVILTGDKDFLSMNLEFPRCMTVSEFLDSEMADEYPRTESDPKTDLCLRTFCFWQMRPLISG